MQGKIRSNCCSEISFKNSFNIYKLLSLHFTGLVLLRMVTATVQCKRQQQGQNKARETRMCCNTHPSSEGTAASLASERRVPTDCPEQPPGTPQSASASAPVESLNSRRNSSYSRPSTALRHPAPSSYHPLDATGPVLPRS